MLATQFSAHSPQLRWLYIDFNSYFASIEQELKPYLRGKPVAVVPVDTDATCAIAASYEAKAFGIKTGTPIYEARRMCPELICVLASHEKYVDFHHRICREVEDHIPVTAVCSIDEVACRLMDNENSEKRATEIALSIKAGLAKNIGQYVKCSIGIAPNRYLAKVATDLKKPDGLTFIHSADLPHKLLGLRLRDLPGVGYNMEHRILMAGINTMEGLLALDAARMRKIWGSVWGERMWFLLRGVDLAELETHRSSVSHSHVMAPELRDPARARYVARRMMRGAGNQRIKKVSMALHGLVPANSLQPELLPALGEADMKKRARAEKMSYALDKINHRFGRDSVTLGMMPAEGRSFSGTKIAFTRIPDVEEFLE